MTRIAVIAMAVAVSGLTGACSNLGYWTPEGAPSKWRAPVGRVFAEDHKACTDKARGSSTILVSGAAVVSVYVDCMEDLGYGKVK
jgi:hypothetical protein